MNPIDNNMNVYLPHESRDCRYCPDESRRNTSVAIIVNGDI